MKKQVKTTKSTEIKLPDDLPPSDYDFSEWLLHQLEIAYLDARKGKRRSRDEYRFEAYLLENLVTLRDDILHKRYTPSRGIAFVTTKPVLREIFAAPFRDRVVHHFLYNMVAEWWDRKFIYDSYSCRKGKGTLLGIKRLQHHIASVSRNYTRRAYVIKLDIQGYFMSLPRKALYDLVREGAKEQFKDRPDLGGLITYIWEKIIFDDPVKGVKRRPPLSRWDRLPKNKSLFCQPPGKGIVIGNLSSQLLSNIYLNQLDKFVQYGLGYKHYGRYVDDFYIVVTEEEFPQAKKDITKIREFLCGIDLTLHPKKHYIQEVQKGVEFLGVVIYPYHVVMGKRFKRNFYQAAAEVGMGQREIDSVVSYLGHSTHFSSKALVKRVFDRMGWDY